MVCLLSFLSDICQDFKKDTPSWTLIIRKNLMKPMGNEQARRIEYLFLILAKEIVLGSQ